MLHNRNERNTKENRTTKSFRLKLLGMILLTILMVLGIKNDSALADTKPGNFSITNPTNNSYVDNSTDLKIQWTASQGAEYYKIVIHNLTDNQCLAYMWRVNDTNYTLEKSNLRAGASYRTEVFACMDGKDYSGGECYFQVQDSANAPYLTDMIDTFTINEGQKVQLIGNVYAKSNITKVTADITDNVTSYGSVTTTPNSSSYSLTNITLDASMLKKGTYTIRITAYTNDSVMNRTATLNVNEVKEQKPYVSGLNDAFTINSGNKLTLNGIVYADSNLTEVKLDVENNTNVNISKVPNTKNFALSNLTLDTSRLQPGTYVIRVWVKTANAQYTEPIATVKLTINNERALYVENMSALYTVEAGKALQLSGTVRADSNINNVTVNITDTYNTYVSVKKYPYNRAYSLNNFIMDTNKLKAGTYTIEVWADTTNNSTSQLVTTATLSVNDKAPYVEGMNSKFTISQGQKIQLNGTVKAASNLTYVRADIYDNKNTSISPMSVSGINSTSYALKNFTLDSSKLSIGTYTIRVYAQTSSTTVEYPIQTAQLVINNSNQKSNLDADVNELQLLFSGSDYIWCVTKDIGLPNKGSHGSTITWSTNNWNVITNAGRVVRPAEDTKVILTAALKNGSYSTNKAFEVVVKGRGYQKEESITINMTTEYNGGITLDFTDNLSSDRSKNIARTEITFYNPNKWTTVHTAKENKKLKKYSAKLAAGEYDVTVLYYDSYNTIIARGDRRITYPISIENLKVPEVVQKKDAKIQGTITSIYGIDKIYVRIENVEGDNEIKTVKVNANGAKSYSISGSELDKLIKLDQVKLGKKTFIIRIIDKEGNNYRETVDFNVKKKGSAGKDSYWLYSDVKVKDWFYDYVEKAFSYGILGKAKRFSPSANTSIKAFLSWSYKAMGVEVKGDVVAYAVSNKVIKTDDDFYTKKGEKALDRKSACLILYRMAESFDIELTTSYTGYTSDVYSLNSKYQNAVKRMIDNGILNSSNGAFNPDHLLSRANAITVILRLRDMQ